MALGRAQTIARGRRAGVVSRCRARASSRRRDYWFEKVSVIARGRKLLRAWLSQAPSRAELDAPADPLRIRLYFIGLLARNEQERFFDESQAGLKKSLADSEAYVETYANKGPEAISRLAARGAVYATRARMRWLKEVREAMLGPS